MSWDRAADDAFKRLLGYSQERLDRIHKAADERRAMLEARDPQPSFEWVDSDSDFDDADRALLSPPPSPKGDGPDLSITAWDRRKWSDLARGIETRDSGFDNFETWRCHVISEHAQKVLPISTPSKKSGVRKNRRPAVIVSERQVQVDLSTLHFR